MTLNNGKSKNRMSLSFQGPPSLTYHLFPSEISLRRPGTSLGQASRPLKHLQCAL